MPLGEADSGQLQGGVKLFEIGQHHPTGAPPGVQQVGTPVDSDLTEKVLDHRQVNGFPEAGVDDQWTGRSRQERRQRRS